MVSWPFEEREDDHTYMLLCSTPMLDPRNIAVFYDQNNNSMGIVLSKFKMETAGKRYVFRLDLPKYLKGQIGCEFKDEMLKIIWEK